MKKNTTLTFIISYLVYSCVYLLRLNLSIASPMLKSENILTESELGLLSGLFLITYAMGKLFFGGLGDKISPKIIIVGGLSLAIFANTIFSILPSFAVILILWVLNGLGQSLIWGPLLVTLSNSLPDEKRKNALSLFATCIGIGSILGIIVPSIAISKTNKISSAFLVPAIIGFVSILCYGIFVKTNFKKAETQKRTSLITLLKSRRFTSMLVPAFLHGIIKDNINVWVCLFFATQYNLDLKNLTFYVFLIPALTLLGRLIYVPMLRMCHMRENLVASVSMLICAVLSAILIIKGIPVYVGLIAFGGTALFISSTNTTILTMFPAHFSKDGCMASVASYMDVVTYAGAGLGSICYGFIVKHMGYSTMFISWAVFALISSILLFITENKAQD